MIKLKLLIFSILAWNLGYSQLFLKTGYSYSTIKSDVINSNGMGGFMAGFGGNIVINPKENLHLFLEMGYTGKGFHYNESKDGAKIKFHFLTFTNTLTYKLTRSIALEGGVEFGTLVVAKYESDRFENNINVSETYNSWDIGLVSGFGFLTNKRLNLYLRYIHGLNNQLSYPDIDDFGDINGEIRDIKHRTIQIACRFLL